MFKNSKQKAFEAADKAIARQNAKLENALRRYAPPSTDDAAFFRLLVEDHPVCGYLPMSIQSVRRCAQRALITAMLRHFARVRDVPRLRHFLFTGCFNDGFSWEDEPEVLKARMQLKVQRALRDVGLHGACAFEQDLLSKKLPGENARRLMTHVHAICWTTDRSFTPRAAEASLTSGFAFRNNLGASPIKFTSRAESSKNWPAWQRKHPDRDQIASSMAWLAYYLLKAPHFCKNLIRANGTRTRLFADAGSYRLKTALRMAEIWSNFSPFDTVFGVSDGAEVVEDFRAQVRAWEQSNRIAGIPMLESEVRLRWRRLFDYHDGLDFDVTRVIH